MEESDGNGIAITGLTSFSGGGIVNGTGATISASIRGIYVGGVSTFTGNVSNAGTISAPSAIVIAASTIAGAIIDSGSLLGSSHGIAVDAASKITSATSGIVVSGSTFTGGISNAGTISASGDAAIRVADSAVSFSGGVLNAGTLIALATGIFIGAATFGGGVSNSGTITGGNVGIGVDTTVKTFAGGIANSGSLTSRNGKGINLPGVQTFSGGIDNQSGGTISAALSGIFISGTSFAGGVTNAGLITGGAGIVVSRLGVFSSVGGGGIANSGSISVGGVGVGIASVSTFDGNITNGGTITAKTGIGVIGSTIVGSIVDSGSLLATRVGISIDGTSKISGGATAIAITGPTFTGGISNAGVVLGANGDYGIRINGTTSFAGNISNSGTVSGPVGAVVITAVSTFAGGIDNTGLLAAGAGGFDAIKVTGAGTFGVSSTGGGIVNSGTLSGSNGIAIGNVTTFQGGITNTQKITANSDGIIISVALSVSGAIVNSAGGTISAGLVGIALNSVTNFGTTSAGGGISNAGTISAATGIKISGDVVLIGSAAIVNTGNITGTGGTAINVATANSKMVIDQNGGTITGNVLLSPNADVMTIAGGTIVGNIVGQGDTLNFSLGAGTTYTDSNTFTTINQVNINSGTVLLDATDSATNIDVFSGATLGGTGTLDPNLTIHGGGTFAPGAPGTFMQITGSLTLQSAAIYMVTINGAATSGANVTGSAMVDAGALVKGNPTSTAVVGTKYTILTASTGVTGTFADTDVFFGRYEGVLSYDADDVFMTVQNGALVPLLPPNPPQNVLNVANAIDTAIQSGVTPPTGFQNLFNYSPAQLQNALAQLEGQQATDAGQGAFQLMTDFLNLLLDPTAGNGGGIGGNGPQQFAPDDQPSLPPEIAEAYNHVLRRGQPAPAASFDQRWTAWGSAFGGYNTTDGNTAVGSADFTASDYGFAAGMTYHVTPATSYGFALAGGGTNWNLSGGLGGGRSDAFQAGVYGTTHYGPAYLSGALAFANHWFTTNRIAVGDQLTASFQGQSYAARGEAGYRYGVPVTGYIIGVTPYAALQVQSFHTPGYSETDLSGGGFGLTYNAMSATDTRSELGARFDNLTMWYDMPVILRGRLAWAHDWISNPSLGAVFQALPGSSFTVNGATPPQNSALTTAAAELHMTANWSLIAKFDGEFAPTAQTYSGTGTLRYSW